jgi:hypothetical protein
MQALGVVAESVRPLQDPGDEHVFEALGRRRVVRRQPPEHLEGRAHVRVDDREGDLLLAAEVEVDGALSDPCLPREVFDRHVSIAAARQESVRGGYQGGRGVGHQWMGSSMTR